MDKCWQSHAESRWKLTDCINGTAEGDRKRKKRRGGRKEEKGKKKMICDGVEVDPEMVRMGSGEVDL